MNNRNIQLDVIRCVALFLIILCHTQIGLEGIAPGIAKVKWFIGKCGVPLFLIISGYLNLPMKYKDGEFLNKRIIRVFIPFLLWCIIYRICFVLFEGGMFYSSSSEDIFLIASSAHLWYIYAILALYLVTPIISSYFKICSKRLFSFYLIIWLISAVLPYYYHLTGHYFFDHNFSYITYYIGGYLGYYLLGYYIKRFTPDWIVGQFKLTHFGIWGIILLLILFFMYIGFYHLDMTTVDLSSYTTIVPILSSILAFILLWKINITNDLVIKVITSISKYSFGIYLAHEIVILYIFPLFVNEQTIQSMGDVSILAFNILLVLLNIVISYCIIRLLSLLPKSKYIIG